MIVRWTRTESCKTNVVKRRGGSIGRGETDVGRMYKGIGLSLDKMLGNCLTADTASDIPVTGEWVLTGKKFDSYLSMEKKE